MTPCERCRGTGEVERTVGGSGVCEMDVVVSCPECRGLKLVESVELLEVLELVREFHRLAIVCGRPGLGVALGVRIHRALKCVERET